MMFMFQRSLPITSRAQHVLPTLCSIPAEPFMINPPTRLDAEHGSSERLFNWLPRLAAVASACFFLLHSLMVIFGSQSTVMEWLYDDAFYYMITAKHFSERHISSFDGFTLTTGYHPLWMWLCAIIYRLHG